MGSLRFNHISFSPPKTFKRSQKSKKALDAEALWKLLWKRSKKSGAGAAEAVRHRIHKSFPHHLQTDRMSPSVPISNHQLWPCNRGMFQSLCQQNIFYGGVLPGFLLCVFHHKISYFGGDFPSFTSNIKMGLRKSNEVVVGNRLTSSNKTNPIATRHNLSSAKVELLEHLSKISRRGLF